MTSAMTPAAMTYRRDRFGETWHLIPSGELGPRGRTLCGEPRQGTPLSETYAEQQPSSPERVCPRCTERVDSAARLETDASASAVSAASA
ncbi:MAG TPA: hypothetical protein VGQ62_21210 [Chloroflexota bacterium]|jgi:hypothetical protein|nr:hypothetical protein [Chloroflexota bacterium]